MARTPRSPSAKPPAPAGPATPPATRAPRMSAQARHEQLLDSAVRCILEHGLSTFSLDKVAQHAGVSLPLVYKHFARREDLLRALLEREYRVVGTRPGALLPPDEPLETLIRRSNLRGFAHLYERGEIIRLLAADRSVAALARKHGRTERRAVTDLFIDRLVQRYGVPRHVALACSILVVNAPILSGRALKKSGLSAAEVADIWSDFVIGGWQSMQERHARPPGAASTPPEVPTPVNEPGPEGQTEAGAHKATPRRRRSTG